MSNTIRKELPLKRQNFSFDWKIRGETENCAQDRSVQWVRNFHRISLIRFQDGVHFICAVRHPDI